MDARQTEIVERLARENHRLRRQEARLRAIEESRWWRLHPRLLWRRVRASVPDRTSSSTEDAHAPIATSGDPDSALLERFRTEVLARGTFTHDWFTPHLKSWEPILLDLEGRTARILEIGCFEGLATCYLLWRLPDARLTCIDTFAGGLEHQIGELDVSRLESAFDGNVAAVDATRVRKLVGDSKRRLLDLAAEGARFDLVYVDGSHLGLDVLVDAALSWQVLANGGVVVFDDYTWAQFGDDPLLRPGPAVDAFLTLVDGENEVLFAREQIAVRKTVV